MGVIIYGRGHVCQKITLLAKLFQLLFLQIQVQILTTITTVESLNYPIFTEPPHFPRVLKKKDFKTI